jgi:hypothetical protein
VGLSSCIMRIEVYNELGRPKVYKDLIGKLGRKVRLWMMLWVY